MTQLDCAGWLLNLRAHDLPCTPLAIAYAFVTMDRCVLFLAGGRLDPDDAAVLKNNGVELRGYGELLDFVAALDRGGRCWWRRIPPTTTCTPRCRPTRT